jgi:hypothetical protein
MHVLLRAVHMKQPTGASRDRVMDSALLHANFAMKHYRSTEVASPVHDLKVQDARSADQPKSCASRRFSTTRIKVHREKMSGGAAKPDLSSSVFVETKHHHAS